MHGPKDGDWKPVINCTAPSSPAVLALKVLSTYKKSTSEISASSPFFSSLLRASHASKTCPWPASSTALRSWSIALAERAIDSRVLDARSGLETLRNSRTMNRRWMVNILNSRWARSWHLVRCKMHYRYRCRKGPSLRHGLGAAAGRGAPGTRWRPRRRLRRELWQGDI